MWNGCLPLCPSITGGLSVCLGSKASLGYCRVVRCSSWQVINLRAFIRLTLTNISLNRGISRAVLPRRSHTWDGGKWRGRWPRCVRRRRRARRSWRVSRSRGVGWLRRSGRAGRGRGSSGWRCGHRRKCGQQPYCLPCALDYPQNEATATKHYHKATATSSQPSPNGARSKTLPHPCPPLHVRFL